MISDRSYMRDPDPARELAPLLWLVGALVAGFAGQCLLDWISPGFTSRWLALSADNLLHGRIWVFLTYSFLHDPENLFHLVLNALSILFIGRLLLPVLGRDRLLLAYAGAVLAGGLLWLAVNFTDPSHPVLLGASGGSYGLLALFCCQFAYERMTILLFFIIPVTVIPRYMLMIVGGIETLFFLFTELFHVGARSPYAHSAHVAGMLAGIMAYRAMRQTGEDEGFAESRPPIELPAWMKKKALPEADGPTKPKIPARQDLKAEVDRILDKINITGFGSLTAEEKRTLDQARNLMSKH
ncbi:MAG: rhomboid family intramembrane serine protease [Opitutaceae bacterium]|nr:rhomboid family intramembrane serine protease [Opitutaceae bacterium]